MIVVKAYLYEFVLQNGELLQKTLTRNQFKLFCKTKKFKKEILSYKRTHEISFKLQIAHKIKQL